MTSAISGRIIYKQGPRSYLDTNIRSNSLVFDETNERLLYSTSGVNYFEFYPGPHSSGTGVVSGAVDWVNILNKPTAGISTSGVLTNSDWISFNGKADTSDLNTLSATVNQLMLTSGSGGVSAVDWSIVQNEPVASVGTSGLLSVTDYNKFNNKADVSSIPSTSAYALNTSLSNYYPVSSTGNISGLTSPAQTQISSLSAIVNQLVLTSGAGGVSAVDWSIIQNEPIASISVSGLLSVSDYNKFNNKADVSSIPSTSAYVTSAFVANYVQNNSVSSVSWSGVTNKPTASTSTSGVLTSSDWNTFNNKANISAIPSTSAFITSAYVTWNNVTSKPVASLTTSGVLTSSDYNKFNSKADLSAIPSGTNGIVSADFYTNSRIVILNSATVNVSASNISSATSLPFFMTGYRSKYFYVSGTSAGSYSATIVFNGAKSTDIDWNNDNNISATISNFNNFIDNVYVNNFTKWSGSMTISGTIPAPGVTAYIEG